MRDDPRIHASRELGRKAVKTIAGDLARKGQELLGQLGNAEPGVSGEA